MQMAKTIAALERLGQAGIPISLLTDPCYGGVGSFFIADVADERLIGFAGPQVIEQITKQKVAAASRRPSSCWSTAWST